MKPDFNFSWLAFTRDTSIFKAVKICFWFVFFGFAFSYYNMTERFFMCHKRFVRTYYLFYKNQGTVL